jgi:quercetin dioxygenase-like cupin family protein
MKIVKPDDKEWQEKQEYSKKIFLDENDLSHKGALVQEIKIKPGETAKKHYHKKQREIFYFLTENGYWIINGKKMSFKKGEILVIEPMDRHEVINNTANDYLYLVFKVDYDPEDLYWE